MERLGIGQVRCEDRQSQKQKGSGADYSFLFVSWKTAYDPF